MSTRKIRRDKHGLFIIINGSIHRPQPSKVRHVGRDRITGRRFDVTEEHDGSELGRDMPGDESKHSEGDVVPAKHILYTPYSDVGGELWTTHGEYYGKGDTEARFYDGVEPYTTVKSRW